MPARTCAHYACLPIKCYEVTLVHESAGPHTCDRVRSCMRVYVYVRTHSRIQANPFRVGGIASAFGLFRRPIYQQKLPLEALNHGPSNQPNPLGLEASYRQQPFRVGIIAAAFIAGSNNQPKLPLEASKQRCWDQPFRVDVSQRQLLCVGSSIRRNSSLELFLRGQSTAP